MLIRPVRALSLAFVLILCGCASKFTRANFDTLRPGVDTRDSVREILGDPDEALSDFSQWYFEHPDENYGAMVFFDDRTGKLRSKRWLDDAGSGKRPGLSKQLGLE